MKLFLSKVCSFTEYIIFFRDCGFLFSGDQGDFFYVIESGVFNVIVGGVQVRTLESGGSFGEQALVFDSPRGATIQAHGRGSLFTLDRDTFKSIMVNVMEARTEQIMSALKKVQLLSKLTTEELSKIGEAVVVVHHDAGWSLDWHDVTYTC